MTDTYLWYIPNQNEPGHRGDDTVADHNSLDRLTRQAWSLEEHGWEGALLGTGWGRPDNFTVATALAARTTSFTPLIAARPGYWHPANFASATATLDHLTGGRVRINIVSGKDDLAAYGDTDWEQPDRYARTREFIQLLRRLWTEEDVTYNGEHYQVEDSTVVPRIVPREGRTHPTIYFGGASAAAERVAAREADVQLFWGEPRAQIAERIGRLRTLSDEVGREHPPLEFGLRITTFVRDTREEAWRDAEAKVAALAGQHGGVGAYSQNPHRRTAVGQQRLLELADRGDVLDDNLYTAPGTVGAGGAATTWLVGSPQDVADSLNKYRDLGITHFILSDTPYEREIERQGTQLLPLLKR
ncbi:MAG: LLM class flavin-dependent oxidoreductase [Mycobacteriaceae bacterium]